MFAFEFRRNRTAKSIPARRRGQGNARRKQPMIEGLETRMVLSTSTWSGLNSALWSDDLNWSAPPVSGVDLSFPSGSQNLSNTNDLSSGTSFGAFSVSGDGYSIGGNAVTLTNGINAVQVSGTGTLALPITLDTVSTVDVANAGTHLVLTGGIAGSVGLTKTGAGSLELGGTNGYSGVTTVSAGELTVTGTATGSNFSLTPGSTLDGNGSIGTLLSDGGTVAPIIAGPAVLNVAGSATLTGGSVFSVFLNGTSPGSGGYSQLKASGGVTLNGVTLNPSLGFDPTANESFTLIDNTDSTPITGTFDSLAEGATLDINGQSFKISYVGGTGNDVVLTHLVASTTTLQASTTTPVFGQPVTFTATVGSVGATPTGTVVFHRGATTLGSSTLTGGVAVLDVSTLPVGLDSITAEYLGDAGNGPSTSTPVDVTVSQAGVSVAFSASPNPTVFGQSVTLTATVGAAAPGSGSPTGTVEFFVGAVSLGTANLSAGTATLNTTQIPLGASTLTASYKGDANFLAGDSAPISYAVGQSNTTTTLGSTPNPSTLGQTVTLTASVSASTPGSGTPTGTVQFFSGTTLLGSSPLTAGTATFDTSSLSGGSNSLTAKYLGDTNFAAGTSAALTQQVTQSASTTALTVVPNTSVFGQSVTFTATVTSNTSGTPTPTGDVQFRNGSTTLGTSPLVNGVATFSLSTLPLGSNSISAVYQGNTSYLTSTSTAATSQVSQASTTTGLTLAPSPSVVGQSVVLTAKVAVVSPATGTPTGTVEFFNGSTSVGTATLSNGTATFTVTNLPLGSASFTAQYKGDTNDAASVSAAVSTTVTQATTTVTLNASDTLPRAYRYVTLTADVKPDSGSGVPTGSVVFFVNSVPIGVGTLTGGTASLTLRTLPIGANTITARYFGDSNNVAATSSGMSVVVGDADEQFLNRLYELAFSRPVDLKSMLYWQNRIAAGLSTTAIAFTVTNSPEARANSVRVQYELYLGRPATLREIRQGVPSVKSRYGAKPIVLGSQEFYKNVGGGTTSGYITALGNAILGEPFNATTQAALTRSIQRRTPLTKVAEQALNTLASRQALVQASYTTILGREANTDELNLATTNLIKKGGSLEQLNLSLLTSEEFYLVASGQA